MSIPATSMKRCVLHWKSWRARTRCSTRTCSPSSGATKSTRTSTATCSATRGCSCTSPTPTSTSCRCASRRQRRRASTRRGPPPRARTSRTSAASTSGTAWASCRLGCARRWSRPSRASLAAATCVTPRAAPSCGSAARCLSWAAPPSSWRWWWSRRATICCCNWRPTRVAPTKEACVRYCWRRGTCTPSSIVCWPAFPGCGCRWRRS
mmetsp:Transcript_37599/g.95498  ORF Transcript_37599/g.95498 Transcript_37599/m.95498 type:complete len:208 (+) Transcript_37599:713-1336(+)